MEELQADIDDISLFGRRIMNNNAEIKFLVSRESLVLAMI